jgi:hypothetical protein
MGKEKRYIFTLLSQRAHSGEEMTYPRALHIEKAIISSVYDTFKMSAKKKGRTGCTIMSPAPQSMKPS